MRADETLFQNSFGLHVFLFLKIYKDNVLQVQAGVFLFLCRLEGEIFL